MTHAVSRRVLGYWDGLREGRAAPECRDIDPAAIRDVLASTFVLDVAGFAAVRPRDATFRLCGTRLDALFARPMAGSGFDRIWSERHAGSVGAALDRVLAGRTPVTATARGAPRGWGAVDLELLLLPLAPSGNGRAAVLGSLAAVSSPDWMGLAPAAPLDLLCWRPIGRAAGRREPDTPTPRGAGRFTIHCGGGAPAATTH